MSRNPEHSSTRSRSTEGDDEWNMDTLTLTHKIRGHHPSRCGAWKARHCRERGIETKVILLLFFHSAHQAIDSLGRMGTLVTLGTPKECESVSRSPLILEQFPGVHGSAFQSPPSSAPSRSANKLKHLNLLNFMFGLQNVNRITRIQMIRSASRLNNTSMTAYHIKIIRYDKRWLLETFSLT